MPVKMMSKRKEDRSERWEEDWGGVDMVTRFYLAKAAVIARSLNRHFLHSIHSSWIHSDMFIFGSRMQTMRGNSPMAE